MLFLYTHNSARSQVPEGWLRALGGDDFQLFSAGTEKARLHARSIAAMAELGLDISG